MLDVNKNCGYLLCTSQPLIVLYISRLTSRLAWLSSPSLWSDMVACSAFFQMHNLRWSTGIWAPGRTWRCKKPSGWPPQDSRSSQKSLFRANWGSRPPRRECQKRLVLSLFSRIWWDTLSCGSEISSSVRGSSASWSPGVSMLTYGRLAFGSARCYFCGNLSFKFKSRRARVPIVQPQSTGIFFGKKWKLFF